MVVHVSYIEISIFANISETLAALINIFYIHNGSVDNM